MGRNSKIEWTDHTFNPWMGCTKVSDGCKHCYAETLMDDRWGKVQWGPQGERVRTSASNWKQPLKWNREAEADGVRQRVFCASLADVFEDNDALIDWRLDLFENIVAKTPNLDWLILTKRPGIARQFFRLRSDFLLPNVWIGTSIEDQKTADERIGQLECIPAAIRFLSIEPLLKPVDLDEWIGDCLDCDALIYIHRERGTVNHYRNGDERPAFDWVIVGGESGPKARPMHSDWVRSIRDQCQAAGVPLLFKQWGEWWPHDQGEWIPSPLINHDVPDDDFYKVGKKVAGRLLDGREWNEYPET